MAADKYLALEDGKTQSKEAQLILAQGRVMQERS